MMWVGASPSTRRSLSAAPAGAFPFDDGEVVSAKPMTPLDSGRGGNVRSLIPSSSSEPAAASEPGSDGGDGMAVMLLSGYIANGVEWTCGGSRLDSDV